MKILSLLCLLVFMSCASNLKKAKELSEKGHHEEAIQYWELALKDDKDDSDAMEGLRASQSVVINDRLVKIRDQRTSMNYADALKALKALVELQGKWNSPTDFNTSTFQKQETLALWKSHNDQLGLFIEKGQPLAAAAYLNDYKPVFSHYKSDEQALLYKNIMKVGKLHCQNLITNSQGSPYFESFARQYCHYFGKPLKTQASLGMDKLLISKITPTIEISGIPENMKDVLGTRLQNYLAQSPWYSLQGSKNLPVKISGNFSSDLKASNVDLTHEYDVEVPYTVYKTVKKSRLEPVSKQLIQYEESVPVTKYKTETRTYEYSGIKKTQKIDFKVSGEFKINDRTYSFEVLKNETESRILHDVSRPSIGLNPATTDVTDPMEKFKTLSDQVAETFKKKTLDVWVSSYCVLPAKRSTQAIAENVFRCRKVYSDANKEFVDQWFMNQHGVDSLVAERTLGTF